MNKKTTDLYAPDEARKRFEAALRGARIAGPKHKDDTNLRRRGLRQRKSKKAKV